MLKVLMVHNNYLKIGGEDKSVSAEVEALRGLGHRVETVRVANNHLERVSFTNFLRIFLDWSAVLQFWRVLRDVRPDVVHVQNTFPRFGHYPVLLARIVGIPTVQTVRNYRFDCIAATHWRN